MGKVSRWLTFTFLLALVSGTALAQARAYVSNGGGNTVSVIDTSTNMVVDTVSTGDLPFDLAPSPDGSRMYVTAKNTFLSEISTSINIVTQETDLERSATYIAVHPNGQSAYVANLFEGSFTVLTTGGLTFPVRRATLGGIVSDLALSPDGRFLYIADVPNFPFDPAGFVWVYNTASNRFVAKIPVGAGPNDIAVSASGQLVYVANQLSNTISVIVASANVVGATLSITNPVHLVVTPDEIHLYVSDGSNVSLLDVAHNTVTATIPVGTNLHGMAISPNGSTVYVVDNSANTVSVITTASNSVTATIPVGSNPEGIALLTRRGPSNKDDCKNGGWQSFTNPAFNSQGECIAFFNKTH